MRKRAGRNFHTAREFVQYLKRTLIPDLMRSGMQETARDFQKAALLIERGKRDVSFIGFLKRTLIPDLYDSGSEQTAYDFGEAVEWMERGAVVASTDISEELEKVAQELMAEDKDDTSERR